MKNYQIFELSANCSLERLWKILTEPEFIKKYMFGTTPFTTWEPGDKIEWSMTIDGEKQTFVHGKILEVWKPKKLVYTVFPTKSDIKDVDENHLVVDHTLEFISDNKSKLHIKVGDFSKVEKGEKRYEESEKAWNETLGKIKNLAESL